MHSPARDAAKIEARGVGAAEPGWLQLNLAVCFQPRTSAALASAVSETTLAAQLFRERAVGVRSRCEVTRVSC